MFSKKNLVSYILLLSMTACTVTKMATASDYNNLPKRLQIDFKDYTSKKKDDDEKRKEQIQKAEEIKKKFSHMINGSEQGRRQQLEKHGMLPSSLGIEITEEFFKEVVEEIYGTKDLKDVDITHFSTVINRAFEKKGVKYKCISASVEKDDSSENHNIEVKKMRDLHFYKDVDDRIIYPKIEVSPYLLTNREILKIVLFVIVLIAVSWYYFINEAPEKKTQKIERNSKRT